MLTGHSPCLKILAAMKAWTWCSPCWQHSQVINTSLSTVPFLVSWFEFYWLYIDSLYMSANEKNGWINSSSMRLMFSDYCSGSDIWVSPLVCLTHTHTYTYKHTLRVRPWACLLMLLLFLLVYTKAITIIIILSHTQNKSVLGKPYETWK